MNYGFQIHVSIMMFTDKELELIRNLFYGVYSFDEMYIKRDFSNYYFSQFLAFASHTAITKS